MTTLQDIENIIREEFNNDIISLEIIDNTILHRDHHPGYHDRKITHIKIIIQSPRLDNLSHIKQHQLIFKALAPLIDNPLHAIEIKIK